MKKDQLTAQMRHPFLWTYRGPPFLKSKTVISTRNLMKVDLLHELRESLTGQ